MCLYRWIPKVFPYHNRWIEFISELNGKEKSIEKCLTLIYILTQITRYNSFIPTFDIDETWFHGEGTHLISNVHIEFALSEFQAFSLLVWANCVFGFIALNNYISKCFVLFLRRCHLVLELLSTLIFQLSLSGLEGTWCEGKPLFNF